MNKKLLALLLLCLLPLCGCGGMPAKADYDVIVGTDLHYISPRITDGGEYFQQVLANGDGKLSQYSEEITDTFLAEVITRRPEALILTGDLTFNGAVESHEDLAEKLAAVEAAGIPVLVTTGNHDVFNGNAARYEGDGFERIASAATLGLRQIYGAFGPDEALAVDEGSLSYIYQLNDSTRVLMLDFNTLENPCGISEESLDWVRTQLRQAKKDGQVVLAAGHQNLMQHTIFDNGYVIHRAEQLIKILEDGGVELFLSGHMHIQHWMSDGKLTEIATSALCLSPCQYGLLRAESGKIRYKAVPVDVAAWAAAQGSDNPELLNFASFAAESFDRRGIVQAAASLEETDYGEAERAAMTDYAVAIQRGVFSGDLRGIEDLDPEGRAAALWAGTGNFHGYYLSTVAPEIGMDFRRWEN